jgi:hypothetical protein
MRALLALAVLALAAPACANDRTARSASTNAANMAKAEAAAAAAVNGIAAGPIAAAVATPGTGGAAAPGPQASVAMSAAELGVSAPNSHRTKLGLSPRVGYLRLQAPLTDIDPLARALLRRGSGCSAAARARRAACAHARGLRARQAVCNDGTSAGYYFRKGTDASLWLIYLEGGMWCGGARVPRRALLRSLRAHAWPRARARAATQVLQRADVPGARGADAVGDVGHQVCGAGHTGRYAAPPAPARSRSPRAPGRSRALPCRPALRERSRQRPRWRGRGTLRAGIFETSAKNPWANANVAYLPYCSSDAWVGDVGASNVRGPPRAALRC